MNPSEMTGPQIRAAIKKAQDEVRDEARRGELYAKHGHKHLVKEIDPVNISGSNTPGGGAGGLWPQMHTPTDLAIVSNGVTVTQDYHRISGSGTIIDVHGAVANRLVMFTQVPYAGSGLTVTWRDGAASDNQAASGNIRIHSTRYEPSRFPATPYPLDNPSIVWNNSRYPGSNDSAAWSPIALGWLDNDGFFQLIDLTQAPMALLSDSLQQGATTFDGGGIPINAASSDVQAGSWMLAAPNTSSLVIAITSDTIDRTFGGNYWSLAPQTGTSDNLSNVTPLSNSFSNNTSGRMYSGDWVIVSPATAADTITLKHNTGTSGSKLFCPGDTDLVLTGRSQAALLVGDKTLDTAAGGWRVFSLAGGGSSVPTAGFWPIMNAATTLTIATGAITVTQDHHIVRGEGAAADTLDTINGGVDNKWLVLRCTSEDITIDGNAGNIVFNDDSIITVTLVAGQDQWALLWYDPSLTKWRCFIPNREQRITDPIGDYYIQMATGRADVYGVINPQTYTVTIAGGLLTAVVNSSIRVDTEGAAASDDCDSMEIFSGIQPSGAFIFVSAASAARTVVLKHNSASGTVGYRFFIQGGQDVTLNDDTDYALCVYNTLLDSGNGGWMVVSNIDTISKSVVATVPISSNVAPYILVGPMLQGGTIVSCKAKKAGVLAATAVSATAWIGDITKVLSANANTSSLGSTIFSTKPTIAVGSYYSSNAVLSTTTFEAGDWFQFWTTQTGGGGGQIAVTLEVVYNN